MLPGCIGGVENEIRGRAALRHRRTGQQPRSEDDGRAVGMDQIRLFELPAEFGIEGCQCDGMAVRGKDQSRPAQAAARGEAIADHQPAKLTARHAGRAEAAHHDAIVNARTGPALDPPGRGGEIRELCLRAHQ